MAEDAIAKAGLHFDELNKIRVLEPEIAAQTTELKEECRDFLDSMLFCVLKRPHNCFISLLEAVDSEFE